MPIYEFKCNECGSVTEIERAITKRTDPYTCPDCGSLKTEQQISKCTFTLVGGGWALSGYSSSEIKSG